MKKRFTRFVLITIFCLFPLTAHASTDSNSSSNIKNFDIASLVKSDGSYWVWGNNQSVPTQIQGLTDVEVSFSDGLIMKQDNSVWYWERTSNSASVQIYPVKELNNIIKVYSMWNVAMALDADGRVFMIPRTDGKLDIKQIAQLSGIENVADISSYYEVQQQEWVQRWVFLKKDGTVWKDENSLKSFEPIQSLDHIVHIDENMALKEDGTVWSWATEFTANDTLTDPLTATRIDHLSNIQMIKVSGYYKLAVDLQSHLWFWGATVTGFSDGTTYHNQPVPLQLRSITDVKDAFIVERSLIVLTGDGNLYETSINRETMPNNPSFNLLTSNVKQVKASLRHIILQKSDGTLWGWGVNKHAELGNGDFDFMHTTPVPVQKAISLELNSEPVPLTNGVVIRNGQAFIPIRSIFEKLGAAVTWDAENKIVTINRSEPGKASITLQMNYILDETKLNDSLVVMPSKPFSVNGISYLPLRFISESLGAKVEWVQKEDKISITMQ
ncbi:stalk domain-containing protein [Paenibacillus sediminis]|uniref:Alpha-tubulin suppressor-like RCC1 family protein n=1 Tax=Paenibacillus sediminis TaxID=664909 RepID=A0ABS4H0Z8_9BACL|nr:stalk domain-containing protein [Paenibacillus sediminis]MBP1935947.1 alpha-tubulin suppressor-like RCC1 family protein [Paenibacillus sediminis]